MDEPKETAEISKTIINNIENFQLFTSHTDKYTNSVFEISSPYEFLLPQYLEQVEDGKLNQFFSLDGNNLLDLVSTSLNLKDLFSVIRMVLFINWILIVYLLIRKKN